MDHAQFILTNDSTLVSDMASRPASRLEAYHAIVQRNLATCKSVNAGAIAVMPTWNDHGEVSPRIVALFVHFQDLNGG
jgi:hypothetical protein